MAKRSTAQIGDDSESEYELKMQTEESFITSKKGKSARWEKNKDLFNQFDIVALRSNEIVLVQVKTTNATGTLQEIQDWIEKNKQYLPDNISFRLAFKKYASKRLPMRWIVTYIDRDGKVIKKEN